MMSIALLTPSISRFPSLSMVQPSTFKRGDCLPLHPEILWRIESGFVRTLTWNEQGEVITAGIWGTKDLVGRPLSRLHPYQIECLTPVQASRAALSAEALYPALLSHIQHSETLISLMHGKHISDRLVKLLEWLGQRFGHRTEQGWNIEPKLTHQIIAEVLGTTRVTITRILNQLEEQGRLMRSRQGYVLIQRR